MIGSIAVYAALVLAQSSDTVVVRLGPVGDRPLRTVEEVRIGTLEGSVEESFGLVAGVAVGADRRVYVGDARAHAVRVFDADGRYLRSIGRQGDGPGEFRGLWGVSVLPDGTLAAWDGSGFRVGLFDREGDFLDSFTLAMTSLIGGAGAGIVSRTDGTLLVRTSGVMPTRSERAQEAVYAWLSYAADGTLLDSVAPPRRRVEGVQAAFKIETVSTPSPLGYFVTGRTDAYAFHVPGEDGSVVRLEGDWDPVPIGRQEAAQWRRFVEVADARIGYDSPELPAHKPAWRALVVDAQGRLWVRRYVEAVHDPVRARTMHDGPSVEWVEPAAVWDAIDPGGTYLGTVALPAEAEVVQARGDHLWALEQGSFDEQYVVSYRVEALGGAR